MLMRERVLQTPKWPPMGLPLNTSKMRPQREEGTTMSRRGRGRLETLADNKATRLNAEDVISCQLLESRVKAGDGGGAPSDVGRQMIGQCCSGGIESTSGGQRWERISSHGQAVSNVRGGSGGVDRVLKERRNRLSAKGSAKTGRQTTAQIGNQRSSGQRRRPKDCKGWAASWVQFKPTKLASLQNAKGVGEERNTKAMAKQTSCGSSVVDWAWNGQGGRQNILGRVWARDIDHKDTERIGDGEQVDGLEGTRQPRQGCNRQANKTGSWEGEVEQ
jgi:hypothetical protein